MELHLPDFKKIIVDRFIQKQLFFLISIFAITFGLIVPFLELGLLKVLFLFIAGVFLWTFLEYVFIRFVFHSDLLNRFFRKYFYDFHYRHHLKPKDKKFLLIPFSMMVIIFTSFSMFLYFLINEYAIPAVCGFILGYIIFCISHYLAHYYDSPSSCLKVVWQNHFLHHNLYPDKAFGVSTFFWDKVFGTMPPVHQFMNVIPTERSEYIIDKNLRLIEVKDAKTKEYFHQAQKRVYRDNNLWISPLQVEIENIFSENKNSCFKHGVAKRWIVVNDYNEVIGRIAAFIDFDKMYEGKNKIGSIGFFECVNNKNVAFYLFDQAIHWLKSMYGVNLIQGPVNFGENDKYWGLLVEGFTSPSYGMNYNPMYYKDFFDSYGFKIQYHQLTNYVSLGKPLPERFTRIAQRVASNPLYSFKHFVSKDKDILIKDFVEIYNMAWSSFKNFHPISEEYVRSSFEELKPVLEDEFIWFAYVDNEPAGLMVATPDVNQILKYLDGKLTWRNKLKFLFYKKIKGFSSVRVIIMGIVPVYQRHGLESGMIYHAYNAGKRKEKYKHIELAWVGDFNPKMIAIHNSMGAVLDKKHATYRKELV